MDFEQAHRQKEMNGLNGSGSNPTATATATASGTGGKEQAAGENRFAEIVEFNVAGQVFTTTRQTILKCDDWLLAKRVMGELVPKDSPILLDQHGRYFIDRDSVHFAAIMKYLRDGKVNLPKYGTSEWDDIWREVEYYQLHPLLEKMERAALEELASISDQDIKAIEAEQERLHQRLTAKELLRLHGREIEQLRVEMQRLTYAKNQKQLLNKHQSSLKSRKTFAFNLIIAGVTGTGKSSTLNTLLDSQRCTVGGGQAQGTRGCVLSDGTISQKEVISFIDTQGLGADTSISDAELLENIMLATESILKLEVINTILLSFDLNQRITPAAMANQLTLIELFAELRSSCFVCFTKWNTNSVLSEWNQPLRAWIKRHRRRKSVEEIAQANDLPPDYETMYQAYCAYVVASLSNNNDGGAFSKMGAYLGFFEARVLWMYNLDDIQVEDRAAGDLEPYHVYLYEHYRKYALDTIRQVTTVVHTQDLLFLKSDKDTMKDVATKLIRSRDVKLRKLDLAGAQKEKREHIKRAFLKFVVRQKRKIADKNFASDDKIVEQVASVAGVMKTTHNVGCVVS